MFKFGEDIDGQSYIFKVYSRLIYFKKHLRQLFVNIPVSYHNSLNVERVTGKSDTTYLNLILNKYVDTLKWT